MSYYNDDPLDYSPYTAEDDSAGSEYDPGTILRKRQTQPGQTSAGNDYSRYYQQYGGSIPPAVSPNDFQFVDPNDPDIAKLRDLGAKDSGARSTLENYYSSMPTHDQYEPGIGRKILGFLAGTLTGQGARGAEAFLDKPYNEAVQEWKMQGPGTAQKAKNLESTKDDEINAVKLGLNLKAAAAKARAGQTLGNDKLAGTLASGATRADDVNEALVERVKNRQDLELNRQGRRKIMDLDTQIKTQELQNLKDSGKLQPGSGTTPNKGTNIISARKAASQDVMAEYPELFDETTGGFKPEVDQLTRQKIQRHRDSLANIYMQGRTPIDPTNDDLGDE